MEAVRLLLWSHAGNNHPVMDLSHICDALTGQGVQLIHCNENYIFIDQNMITYNEFRNVY